jgi:tetratricopeptide (TPR) repeat protein
MIEPFLAMDRSNLANQSMALLAQIPRREEASLHLAIARLNLDSENLPSAEDSLRKADEWADEDSPLYAEKEELWGRLYDAMGSSEEAAPHFLRAAMTDPSRPLSLRKLAEISAHNQDWPEAAQWMRRFIDTKPTGLGHYWAMLGDYYLADQNTTEAMKALQTALEVDPYSYWAHYRMARVFELKEDVPNAIEQYEFLLKYAYDREADFYIKLTNLYKSENRMDDARRVIEKGHRLFPTNVSIYRLYEEVLGE